MKIVAHDGKHKLADLWEQDPYIVMNQPNSDIPVYTVKKENGEGKPRTLHRNLLLPIGYVSEVPVPAPRLKQQPPAKPPRRRLKEQKKVSPESDTDTTSDEESESHFVVINTEEQEDSDTPIAEESQVSSVDEVQLDEVVEDTELAVQEEEPHGDAHASSLSDNDGSGESAQEEEGDHQEDTSDDEDLPTEEIEVPVPLRRSTRERRQPAWIRSGAFETSKSAVDGRSDWMNKVNCITSLISSNLFAGIETEAGRTILEILKTTDAHTPDSK